MITWTQFEQRQPALAATGREHFYHFGVGLGFLATVRKDGGPRVHPVCPVLSPAGLHVSVIPGPKLRDLRRDPRYALHSDSFPPPREDDGFALYGTVHEVTDAGIRATVHDQVIKDHEHAWEGYEDQTLFELRLERCLLMLTQAGETFPQGPTIWRA
jgi:hypothetical protein